jgi:NADP-dependent 3-hydroxy acid dehydrogenase YdfG
MLLSSPGVDEESGVLFAVVARSAEQVATTVTMLQALGARAIALPADVTDQHAVAWAVEETTRQLGAVDLLVNNAGSGRAIGPIWEVDPEMWWEDVTTNLRGTFLCSCTVLPKMIARRRGRIINVASLFGIRSVPGAEPSPYGSG